MAKKSTKKKTTKKKTTKKQTAKKKAAKKQTAKKQTTKKKTAKKKTTKKKTTKKKTAKKQTAKKKTAKKTAKKKTTKKQTTKKKTAKKKTTKMKPARARAATLGKARGGVGALGPEWSPQPIGDSIHPSRSLADVPRLTEWPKTTPGSPATMVGGGGPIAGERRPTENASFDAAFESASVSVRAIGVRLRRLILGALPDAREAPFGGSRVRGLEFYARDRDPHPIVTLQPAEVACLFTLQDGARMNDPRRLLAGTGSSLRHVKVFDFDNPPDEVLLDFIEQGIRLAQHGFSIG